MFKLIHSECMRVFLRPGVWIAIFGIAVIKLINILSGPDVYTIIFEMGIKEESLLSLDHVWARESFLGYVTFCLAAFPVVGNYLEDCKSGRINMVLTRVGKVQYIVMRMVMVVITTSVCMLLGNILFMLAGHYIIGLPYAREGECMVESSLLKEGHTFIFWLVTELQNCMQAAFYGLLSVAVSLFARDMQFIVVLPMLFRYIFIFFVNENVIAWYPQFISPRAIYLYNYGMFSGDGVMQFIYSAVFTLCTAICVAVLMNVRLRKEL